MKYHISFIMLYLIICAVLGTEKQNQNVMLRLLTTCNSISDGYTCQNDSSCTYLNGICSSSSTSTITTDVINTSTEFQYGNQATIDGTVNIDNLSLTTLSLYQYSSSSYTDHPSCYWSVVTNSPQNILVTVSRSLLNNEDIYIQTQSQGGTVNSLTSKSFSNGRDSDYNLKVDNMAVLKIKVKRLNQNSAYKITVTKESSSSSEMPYYVIAVALFFSILLVVGIVVTIICIIFKVRKPRESYIVTPDQVDRINFIKLTMASLTQGKHKDLRGRFKDENCAICLDKINSESDIIVINQGYHPFHHKGLEDWFWSIRIDQNLRGPLGCAIVTPTNTQQSRNITPTDLSIIRDTNRGDESLYEIIRLSR